MIDLITIWYPEWIELIYVVDNNEKQFYNLNVERNQRGNMVINY